MLIEREKNNFIYLNYVEFILHKNKMALLTFGAYFA
jgi:hypothetical protein